MSVQVEGLEIEVKSKADETKNSIKGLKDALKELKSVVTSSNKALFNLTERLDKIKDFSTPANAIKQVGQSCAYLSQKVNKATSGAKKLNDEIGKISENAKETINPQISPVSGTSVSQPTTSTTSQDYGKDYWQSISELDMLQYELKETVKLMEELSPKGLSPELDRAKRKYDELNEKIKKAKDGTSGLTKNLGKAVSRLGQMIPALNKVANVGIYRAVRTVLSQITNLLKEGVTNAYQFSKAMGGNFATQMDAVNSKYLQLKNQIGSVASEILMAVFPSLTGFMDSAIDFANTLSQIIATLNGKTTYKKANYVANAWQDATASAKAYKTQVLGIDELNILSDDSGSGGSSSSTDYEDMFTYADIDDKWLNKAEEIKSKFEEIKSLAGIIGNAIVAWHISSTLANALQNLGALSAKQSLGLTLAITGMALEFSGAYDIGKNGLNLKNAISTALGAGALIGGGVLAFGATSLIISVPLSILIAWVGIELGKQAKYRENFNASELGIKNMEINETFSELRTKSTELIARITSISTEIDSGTQAKLQTARELIEDIFNLDVTDNKTTQQIEELKTKIETLNGLGLDGIKLQFDEAKQKVVETREEVSKVIDELERQYKVQAFGNAIVEAEQAAIDAEIAFNTAKEEYENQLTVLAELQAKRDSLLGEYDTVNAMRATAYSENNWDTYYELQDRLNEISEEIHENDTAISDVNSALKENKETYDIYAEALQAAQDKVNEVKAAFESYNGVIQSVTASNDNAIRSFRELADAKKAAQEAMNLVTTSSASMRYQQKAKGGIVEKYASGGVPTHGQLFIANEGNSPEMIGSWGTQTAVANTDQIVNGIQAGVSSAVNAVLAPYLSQIANNTKETANKKLSVNIGDREIAKANARGSKMLGRTIIATS